MGKRLDIWWNGSEGVKEVARDMLVMWKYLPHNCGCWGESLVELLTNSARVVITILFPFLFWLAPLIAILTAHRFVSDDEIKARMRRNMHRNGNDE